jgi:hypothetical protein
MKEDAAMDTISNAAVPEKAPTKEVTPETLPELVSDLADAHATGLAAVREMEDGGTCNLDAPVLAITGKPALRLAAAAIRICGGSSFTWKWGRTTMGLVVSMGAPGQASVRTRYAEVFQKALAARGWPTSMYYQMD